MTGAPEDRVVSVAIGDSGEPTEESLKERIELERVRELYAHAPLVLTAVIVASLMMTLLFRDRPSMVAWFVANLGLCVVRWWQVRRFFRRLEDGRVRPSFDAGAYALGSFFFGILWGMPPWLLWPGADMFDMLVTIVVLLGMVSGALGSHGIYPLVYTAFAAPAVGMTSLRVVADGGEYVWLGGLILAYFLVHLGYARLRRQALIALLRQRFENERLLEQVRARQARADRLHREKSRILATVNHDLRQPLHALGLNLAALDRSGGGGRTLRDGMAAVHGMEEMLDGLMELSMLEDDSLGREMECLPLAPMLDECARSAAVLAREHRLELRYRRPSDGLWVETHPRTFKRMVSNLLGNAVRYTQTGGVLLGVRRHGETALVEVWDTGIGIAREHRQRIFDEFFQVDNPERDRRKGIGLGLAMVRRAALTLNHGLEVESRPGRGSCFRLRLAAHMVDAAMTPDFAAARSAEPGPDVGGMSVIVVDDDVAILEAMRRLLRGWGCEVILAESGAALISELKTHGHPRPDMVLCDYRLREGEDALAVAGMVRAHFGAPDLPVVVVSGDLGVEARRLARAAGCQWLDKPVNVSVLRRLLADFRQA